MVLLIAAALAYYLLRPRGDIDSIAVLPFTNASNDPNLEYQADGLTEELINSLTQAPNLKVIARATVFRYKGRALDPQEIGKQLGVRSVLMGRIVRMDDRATVQADLVDARDGSQVWGRQFNRPVSQLQAIHEEIAQQVIGKVQPGGADQKRLAKTSHGRSASLRLVSSRPARAGRGDRAADPPEHGVISAGHRARFQLRRGVRGLGRFV